MDKEQVVCRCTNVTIGDLVREIENGAKVFEDVQNTIKVGTRCKRCTMNVRDILSKLIEL